MIHYKINIDRLYFTIFGFLLLVLVSGCRKDEIKTEHGGPIFQGPSTTIETRLEGIINDESGIPMSDVTISIEGKQTTTNENGFFRLPALSIKSTGSLVIAEKQGHITGYKIVYPFTKSSSYVEFTLIETTDPTTFMANNGGATTIDGGGTINFSPNSIVYESGGSYDGEVKVYSHWYDPTDLNTPLTMPGNLYGQDEENNEFQLQSFGMVNVVLKSSDDKLLQIKDGNTANIKFPALTTTAGTPSELPLWYFDEAKGMWIKEGLASLNGDHYEGEVSHFSFWNCDVGFPLVEIEGRLIDNSGVPVSNYPVYVYLNNWFGGYEYTNVNGEFKGKVPQGQALKMRVYHCGLTLVDEQIGPFPADQDLGDYTVQLTDFAFTLTGTLLGCGGLPNSTAYGVAKRKLISANPDGTFATIISGCGESTTTATFSDPTTPSTKIETFPTNQSAVDLGDVVLCDLAGAYITFTIDGDNASLATDPAAVFIDEKIDIRNEASNTDGVYFTTNISEQTVGTTNPITTNIYSIVTGQYSYNCNFYSENPCDDFDFTIVESGGVGDTLRGYFTGTLYEVQDSANGGSSGTFPRLVAGSFSIPIIKQFNSCTVKGRIWVDENEDGIQDTGEDYKLPAYFYIRTASGASPKYGTTYAQTDSDGNYELSGLEPDDYIVTSFLPNGSDISPKDAGSDDTDNDFYLNNFRMETDPITLMSGEVKENVDMGVSIPDFEKANISYYGCIPEINIYSNAQGGLPPFTYDLSDGQTNSDGIFIVATEGNYTVDITDALGRTQSATINALKYNNSIAGIIWEEDPLATENIFDQNQDDYFKNVTVKLYDDSNTLLSTTLSGQFNYVFTNVEPGMYYVQIDIPTGYELVVPNAGPSDYNNSHINQTTFQSPMIEIVDCNEGYRMNAGLKKI